MTPTILALAAAAYRLAVEVSDPIPQHAVRKQYLMEIAAAERALTTDERVILSKIGPIA